MDYDRILAKLPPKILNALDDENIGYLVDAELIKELNGSFVKTEEFNEIIRFLKRGFKCSITKTVAWAIWYLYNKNLNCFELSQILDVLPPNVNKDRVIKALNRLKLEFKNQYWCLTDQNISSILECARGLVSNWWPSFFIYYVKDVEFFKIARGVSSNIYADFPNDLIEECVSSLMHFDSKCQSLEEFYEKAKERTDYYNYLLLNDLEILFGRNIDWLQFSLQSYRDYYREKKYRVKLNINWRKFLEFLESYSKDEKIEIWKKYRYLSSSRQILCKILTKHKSKIKDELWKIQDTIKCLARYDLADIHNDINDTIDTILIIGKKIHNKVRITGEKKDQYIVSHTLFYIPELISALNALKDLVNRGVFPACYREMRKIVESLAWVMFDDILYFRSLVTAKDLIFRPYSNIPKEWHDLKSKFANIYDIKQAEDKLKRCLRGIKGLKNERNIKHEIIKSILKNIGYLTFIVIFSRAISNIDENLRNVLPILESNIMIDFAKSELKRILTPPGLDEDVINEILEKIVMSMSSEIIIPFPSNRFVLEFIDYQFSTNIYREFYSKYSFFVHSYLASWHILPFSSILEIKIFKQELDRFLDEVKKLFENYYNSVDSIIKII